MAVSPAVLKRLDVWRNSNYTNRIRQLATLLSPADNAAIPGLHMNSEASAWLASASNGKLTVFLMKKRSRFDWDAFFSVH